MKKLILFLLVSATFYGQNSSRLDSISVSKIKLTTTPTSSAGTYDFLTRNASTGDVEKVASNTIATISSPAFTGIPTAPTATVGTNTTQIATTAFVQNAGTAIIEEAIVDGVTNKTASQNKLFDALAGKADKGGAVFTGEVETIGANFKTNGNLVFTSGNGIVAPNNGNITFQSDNPSTPGWISNSNISATFYKTAIYTVATLPTTGVVTGTYATVSDALAPTYMVTVAGGGSVVTPVFYNGTSWVAH